MRNLNKHELNTLNSLHKIEIKEKDKYELQKLRKENNNRKIQMRMLTSFVLVTSCGIAFYFFNFHQTKQKQPPIQINTQYSNSSSNGRRTTRTDRNRYPHKTETVKQQGKGKIHYWTDKNGTVHATNSGIPKNVTSVNVMDEINTYNKRTPIKIKNNRIHIPITLHNNGITIKTEILLDTGCSSTVINSKLAKRLKLKKLHSSTSTVADGRKVKVARAKVGYVKVGPYTESDLKVSYRKHAGAQNTGLLGMDFLKHHPFHIDYDNKVVVWE